MESIEQQDRMMQNRGIGLFKIDYEMDVRDSKGEHTYQAGILAYGSDEAVETLRQDLIKRVKGFKGFKINQVAFDGYCHALSNKVRSAVINGAVNEGLVAYTPNKVVKEKTTKTTTPKRKIVKE